MATEDINVDIPINLGTGESSSEQGRDASFTSKNTRFLKKDSVSTLPPLVETWEAANTDVRLLPTAENVYMVDSKTVNRLDDDGEVTQLSLTARPYSPNFRDVSLGRACLAWPQAVLCGSEVVVTWLEVLPEFGYLPHIAVLDLEGNTLQAPAPVVATGAPADMPVCPKYTLTRIDDDSVVLAYVAAPDADMATPSQLVQVRYARSGTSFVATSDVYFLDCGGFQTAYVATSYDGSTLHHVTYDAPVDQNANWNTGVTRYWRIEPDGTFLSRRDLRADLTASSFAAVAAHPSNGEVWMLYRGYDREGLRLVDLNPGGVPPTPTVVATTLPWFKNFNATGSLNDNFEPHELAFRHFPRLEDGFLFFDENEDAVAVVQGQGAEGASIDGRNLTGMSIIYFGTSISAGFGLTTLPNLSFTGGWFSEGSTFCVPAVERASWHSEFIEAANDEGEGVEIGTPVEVWYRGRTLGGYPVPTQAAITNRPLFPPAYAVNCLVSFNTSSVSVHTFHSMDEATDHTGLVLHPEGSTYSALEPARPANYKTSLGSVLTSGDDVYIITAKQVGARLVGGDGSGGYEAEDVRLEGWGCALNFLKLEPSKDPQSSFTTQQPVVGFDLVSILSGNDILPTALPVPPVASAPSFTGTGADTKARTFRFAWCFIDSDGIRHRGPLSHDHVVRDTSVDITADEGTFRVPVPGSFFSLPQDRFFLEVYANPITDDVVGDTLVLTDTLPLPAPPYTSLDAATIEVPYSYNNTAPGLPFPYTDGGVLPNEARPTTGPITFNRQRVWSFDGTRLFFSKTEGYKKPFGFNSNLYFDSPDGSDFTGVASLDEQTVAFTRSGVYVNRGQLPNDLGAGGSTTLHHVTSPSGCRTHKSVVETPQGVFFLGERGLYLLQRSLEVLFIGYDVEDSLGDASIAWSMYDKGNNEVLFATSDKVIVFNTLLGQWGSRHEGVEFSHGAWHPDQGTMLASGVNIYKESREVTAESLLAPLKHSTPWVTLNTRQGYQRCKKFLIQGTWDRGDRYFPAVFTGQVETTPARIAVDDRMHVTFRIFIDHQDVPASEVVVDLRQYAKRPLELRIPNSAQKCRAVRLEMETEEANLDLSITSVVAVVGIKQGADKRQNATKS